MRSVNNRWLVLAAVLLAFTPIVIDVTILHVAIPSLTLELKATGNEILWMIDIYPLILAGLLVPMGVMTDRVGTRQMLLTGMVLFLLASIAAAFSVTPVMLIAARAALALGSAMMMPPILAIIRRTFLDDRERGVALGLWGTVASAGAAIGPLVGGLLLEHFWWGSVFLINVPVMLIVAPLVYRWVPGEKLSARTPLPIVQALLLISGLILSVFALKSMFKPDQSKALILMLLVIGIWLLTVFGRKQLSSSNPMLDLSLFKHPPIRAGLIMALVTAGALAGVELTLSQELQFVVGKSPLEAGLFLLPLMAAAAVGGPLAGWLAFILGTRGLATASLIVSAISLGGLALSDFHSISVGLVLFLVLLGLGLSVGLTTSSMAIMTSTPAEKAGAAGALESTAFELGSGLGITAFGVMLGTSYMKAITLPAGINPALADQARQSIGETIIVATEFANHEGELLAQAGRLAFRSAHTLVLGSAAGLLTVLAIIVFITLRNYKDGPSKN
jgi:DHA2 family multidrug resistance protein-like MFS transporter